ncbi:MAG: carbon-nitrogen hydrolase family protein [Anaerolineae bacterium]|nr:carbon-nitrogen hydrolase family protein [Anaerolineae bacterium]
MRKLRIGLVQMRCEKGAIEQNLAMIASWLENAAGHDLDILGFPEMSLTGYINPTRQPKAILTLDGPEMQRLQALTKGFAATLLVGLVEHNPAGKPFITQVAVRDGQPVGYYRKMTIEDEEADWFSPGKTVPVFRRRDLTYGIAICADIGNREVFRACAQQGAQIVFELAAPGLYGDQNTRDWASGYAWWEGECLNHLPVYAQAFGYWIGVATQAGRTCDEDFPGGGFLFDPQGRRRSATPDGREHALYIEIDLDAGTTRDLESTL